MRYSDDWLLPHMRNRMREWLHPSDDVDSFEDIDDDDENLAWRQYIV